jgi:hypothetical protein
MDAQWNQLIIIGLFFDIVGVLLIWYFGLPQPIGRSGEIRLVTEQRDSVEAAKAAKFDRLAQFGVALVTIGFVLQLIPHFL